MNELAGRAHTVLVVDDDEGIRFALSDTLEDVGYRVVVAKDGVEALAKLRGPEERPCVILLDLMMPAMDGWTFRHEQRRDPAIAEIPVVVLTADAHVEEKAKELEAQGHIAKP